MGLGCTPVTVVPGKRESRVFLIVAAISGLMGVAGEAAPGWAAAGPAVPAAGFASAHRLAPAASAVTRARTHISRDFAFISGAYRREGRASALPVTRAGLNRPDERPRPVPLLEHCRQVESGPAFGPGSTADERI